MSLCIPLLPNPGAITEMCWDPESVSRHKEIYFRWPERRGRRHPSADRKCGDEWGQDEAGAQDHDKVCGDPVFVVWSSAQEDKSYTKSCGHACKGTRGGWETAKARYKENKTSYTLSILWPWWKLNVWLLTGSFMHVYFDQELLSFFKFVSHMQQAATTAENVLQMHISCPIMSFCTLSEVS